MRSLKIELGNVKYNNFRTVDEKMAAIPDHVWFDLGNSSMVMRVPGYFLYRIGTNQPLMVEIKDGELGEVKDVDQKLVKCLCVETMKDYELSIFCCENCYFNSNGGKVCDDCEQGTYWVMK
jgi:hypothetical protein